MSTQRKVRSRWFLIADELTGVTAMRLADRLHSMALDDIDVVVLSLKGADTVDASGLAVLVRLYSRLVSAQKTLILRDVGPDIAQMIEQLGLRSVLLGDSRGKDDPILPLILAESADEPIVI